MSEMHNILSKLQQLNESTDVTEAEKKCDDCGKPISKCECDDHDHKKDMKESVEARLLKEYAEFKKSKLKEEPNEGNEFSGALAQAKKDGKEEFEVDGKKYKVTAEAKKPYVKPFDASGVRVNKRGKIDAGSRDYYHVKMEKDNVTKAERVLADDGESEMHVRMNAKRDNPGWKIVSVRKVDSTKDKDLVGNKKDKKASVDEGAKPDYLDLDKDGDTKEPMKKAAKDKKEKKD